MLWGNILGQLFTFSLYINTVNYSVHWLMTGKVCYEWLKNMGFRSGGIWVYHQLLSSSRQGDQVRGGRGSISCLSASSCLDPLQSLPQGHMKIQLHARLWLSTTVQKMTGLWLALKALPLKRMLSVSTSLFSLSKEEKNFPYYHQKYFCRSNFNISQISQETKMCPILSSSEVDKKPQQKPQQKTSKCSLYLSSGI